MVVDVMCAVAGLRRPGQHIDFAIMRPHDSD
jgi:hypothetical protein